MHELGQPCPKCGCTESYPDVGSNKDGDVHSYEQCSNCGHVLWTDDYEHDYDGDA